MKKYLLTLGLVVLSVTQMFALSTSSIRTHARFLSDRMAYELDLTPSQYDDVYEINFDFIYLTNRIMNDVVYGYRDAIDRYYDYLDDRNDDLRYVLTYRQYQKFLASSYFYRPIYTSGKTWNFRIYTVYRNHTFFYFDAPVHYKTYVGAHSRIKVGHGNYYSNRYDTHKNDRYNDHGFVLKNHNSRNDYQRHDFGGDVRERNNNEYNKVNNYKNPNSPNRTDNKYYKDNSGNSHSPEINNRNNKSNSTSTPRGTTTTTTTNSSRGTTSTSSTRSSSSSATGTSATRGHR